VIYNSCDGLCLSLKLKYYLKKAKSWMQLTTLFKKGKLYFVFSLSQNKCHITQLHFCRCTILNINIFNCVLLKLHMLHIFLIMKNWYFDNINRGKSNNISYVNIYLYTLKKHMIKVFNINNIHSKLWQLF
jgi:hypothetical protein